jgi:subfamily B ATP-binding cassette protein MsbA
MLVSAESIFTLIDQPSEFEAGQGDFTAPVKGRIEFKDLSHRFPDAESNTLNQVNISVEPGQTVALVGRSGSGKTTLVNMLPRFVLPLSGLVTIDGHDISHLSLNNLRRQLSLVSQDVVLFDDTIAVNVGYGSLHEASEAEIRAALKAANLLDFVDNLPQGINTQVGVNATRLSGGQRQRLAIARALIKNAPILILDEATSALDNESERQVQASLETLMKGRTTVVIAHRLSTVQNADKIVVMDGGRVLEQGTHKELLARGGAYCNLHQMGLN